MSFISLRLPPAKKVWKSFTRTIGKLRRIDKSKAIKKPRKHLSTTLTPSTRRSSKFFARRFRRKKLLAVRSVFYGFHKKPAPVYVDKLFKEPSCEIVKHLQPQIAENPRARKTSKLPGGAGGKEAGTSRGGGGSEREGDGDSTSDDMWESVALASPLMQGINERAEEFIARFRKEMEAQETFARNL